MSGESNKETKVFEKLHEQVKEAVQKTAAVEPPDPEKTGREKTAIEEYTGGKRRVKRWQKILIAVLAVVLLAIGSGYGFIMHKLNQIEKDTDLDLSTLKTVEVPGYRNIVLLGIDTRDMGVSEGSRSDAIMIASINETTKAVRVTSIYRDTMLKMGDWDSYEKVTHAHAYGGAEMTLQTLNQALDLDATEYIEFNFKAVADAVDAVGGITVDVKEKEIEELNKYTIQSANSIGKKDYHLVEEPGEQVLDGAQAVSYGRIRKGVGDDYKRTERMRIVMELLLEEVKGMSVGEINNLLSIVLPQIKTNLTNAQILDLMADINKYEITESLGFPFQKYGTYIDGVSVVVPLDLEADVIRWHEKMFGQIEGYTISPQAKEISDHIKAELLDEANSDDGY